MTGLKQTHLAVLAALAVAGCAQEERIMQEQVAEEALPEPIDLGTWDQAPLRAGFRAEEDLFDTPVYGAGGEEIGSVENVVVGPDGTIEALIVEAGAFLDIGGTSFRVPWDQVELGPELEAVRVPVRADNIDRYTVFQGTAEGPGQVRAFRATEVIGDYVRLEEDDVGFGMIDDLIFSREGELLAVVAQPDVGFAGAYGFPYGYYAFPYYGYGYGYGFGPGLGYYGMPYGVGDLGGFGAFDYGAV